MEIASSKKNGRKGRSKKQLIDQSEAKNDSPVMKDVKTSKARPATRTGSTMEDKALPIPDPTSLFALPTKAELLNALKLLPSVKDMDWNFLQATSGLEKDLAKHLDFLKVKEEKSKERRILKRRTISEANDDKKNEINSCDIAPDYSCVSTASSLTSEENSTYNTTADSSYNTTADSSHNMTTDNYDTTADNYNCNTVADNSFDTTDDDSYSPVTNNKLVKKEYDSCNATNVDEASDESSSTGKAVKKNLAPSNVSGIALNFITEDSAVIATCNLVEPGMTLSKRTRSSTGNKKNQTEGKTILKH